MEFIRKIFFIFLIFTCQLSSFAVEPREFVRVGISDQKFSTYLHTSANFIAEDTITILDLSSDKKPYIVASRTPLGVVINEGIITLKTAEDEILKTKGPIVLSSNAPIGIIGLNRKGTPARYEGQIEIKSVNQDKFNIINVLSMQAYLKGVVPNEMPNTFPKEALKAQAIAARNYANRDVNPNPNYNVVDSHLSQVYYGHNSRRESTDTAVDETLGFYALWELEPITALYFSTSAGITENWKDVFAQSSNPYLPKDLPYMVSVWDNPKYKTIKSEKELREFLNDTPESYDIKSPKYRWSVSWDKEELEQILPQTLLEQSKGGLVEPLYIKGTDFGKLEDIIVLERGVSGKALVIEIITDRGRWKVKKELGIRRVLKKEGRILNSANFYITKEKVKSDKPLKTKQEEKEEKEPIFSLAPLDDKIIYKIVGGGYGHGVGMSQWGASYMAQKGFDYIDILKHYYTGITIGTIPKTVSYNPWGQLCGISFYYNFKKNEKYYLKADNSSKLTNLNFFVNEVEFNPELTNYSSKFLMFDITPYLQKGVNTITIKPLQYKDKNKNTKVWVEVVK